VRPIRVRNLRPHEGQTFVGEVVDEDAARALRSAHFPWAATVRQVSAARAPMASVCLQVGRFIAEVSQLLTSISRAFRDRLRLFLKRFFCPPAERFPWLSSP